eukprot:CAMPEP_0177681008 /NCGR_PEP_ID=MMETSP0447-20121125/30480_1 /TAXON_ID=0 /ORGANISM="Stygamoeba regulata, Strain BSH-02190019" /LENGTH=61 /DNA_ID=CAMNT_0019190383 /DNA_START=684 /DNA_END=869 /DNA_ORIENTATION=-
MFGIMPATLMAVKAGLTLQDMTSASDVLDVKSFVSLILLACLALLPTAKPVQRFLDRAMNK